jgi:hypothetical protein
VYMKCVALEIHLAQAMFVLEMRRKSDCR